MPKNVEIKANVSNLARTEELAQKIADTSLQVLKQRDTFFNCGQGRLKLRVLGDDVGGQLIQYNRTDQSGPKMSEFYTAQVTNADDLRVVLERAYGIKGEVKKVRHLYMSGQTRIHLDTVDKLGDFMELEVLMKEGQSVEEGERIAHDLMDKLEISKDNLIEVAYMDLLLAIN